MLLEIFFGHHRLFLNSYLFKSFIASPYPVLDNEVNDVILPFKTLRRKRNLGSVENDLYSERQASGGAKCVGSGAGIPGSRSWNFRFLGA